MADFQVSGRNVDIAFQFGTEQVAVLRDDAEWRLNSWFSRDDSRAGRELARRTRRALENDVPVEVMQGNAIGAR